MGKIIALDGGPAPSIEPNEVFVKHLRGALAKAEAGEIIGGAFAYQFRDRSSGVCHVGATINDMMLGALTRLQWRIAEEAEGAE